MKVRHPVACCTVAPATGPTGRIYNHVHALCEVCGAERLYVGLATSDPYTYMAPSRDGRSRPATVTCDGTVRRSFVDAETGAFLPQSTTTEGA